jgi:spore maturation protein CgeB
MRRRVLYYGTLEWGSTSLLRMQALHGLVPDLYAVDMRITEGEYIFRTVWQRLQIRTGVGPLVRRSSLAVIREALRYEPDVVWIDEGLCVTADSLRAIKSDGRILVHYTPDTITGPGFTNLCFSKAAPVYDLCITTKPHETAMFRQKGAKNVLFSEQGFEPQLHRPYDLNDSEKTIYECDVAFAGDYHADRAASLARLALESKSRVHLYGRNWDKGKTGRVLAPLSKGWVFAQNYGKALSGARICLCFLSYSYGDRFTTRSLEIPACGSFMLAQRTEAHKDVFTEDVEAAYFGSDEELIDKVDFYLSHPEIRERIARAGHEKVMSLGLTWRDNMKKCLDFINKTF